MAVSEALGLELEREVLTTGRPLPLRILSGIGTFARRKPLGFACACWIAFLMTLTIPWVTDAVAPYPYDQGVQHIRHGHRLQGGFSTDHFLGTDNQGRDTFSRLV